jgi:DNA-binding protein HU-beta
MRKSELVAAVADKADLETRQADNAVAAIFEQITNALSRGESVNLVGFGSFVVKARAARSGHNPQTGAVIAIPAAQVPSFKAGQKLKDAVQ